MAWRRFAYFILLWLAFIPWVQPSAFWRDSGEFIIAARYLDISHPGGFPLYAQLANLIALLPIGTIALRVNAFTAITGALFLTITANCAWDLLRLLKPDISPSVRRLGVLSAVLFPLGAQAFLKQGCTAEVYVLNGALQAGLFFLFLQWYRSRDLRWIYTMAFLAALTLGNHAASGMVLVPAALITLVSVSISAATIGSISGSASRIFVPACLIATLGVSVFAFLPVRAAAHPPLNTGNPITLQRFAALITDGRDRALRADPVQNDLGPVESLPSVVKLAGQMKADWGKGAQELTPVFLAVGALGILFVAFAAPALGLLLAVISAGTWYFFQGWDPDPWMPIFFALTVGGAFLIAAAASRLGRLALLLPLLFVVAGAVHLFQRDTLLMLTGLSYYEDPADVGATMLSNAPHGGAMFLEPAWFFVKYARDIEGVGEDRVPLYQPSILFPGYFNFPPLLLPSRLSISILAVPSPEANLEFAGRLISTLAPYRSVGIEAGSLNTFLSPIVQFRSSGGLELVSGARSTYEPGFIESTLQSINVVRSSLLAGISSTGGDAKHFAELRAVTTADLLTRSGLTAQAAEFLEQLCAPQGTSLNALLCGEIPLNNLGTYDIALGKYARAEEIFSFLISRGISQRAVAETNLNIARAKRAAEAANTNAPNKK